MNLLKTILLVGAGYWVFKKVLPMLGGDTILVITNPSGNDNDDDGKTDPTGPPTPEDVHTTEPPTDTPFYGINPIQSY